MAVPSRRHRAGALEIKNKNRVERKKEEEEKISEDEHKARLDMLKSLGLVK